MEYTVKTGDTMYLIAKRYGVSLDQLIMANPQIANPDLIYPGQVINIPIPPITPPVIPPVIPPVCPPVEPPGGIMPELPVIPELPGGEMPELPGGEMPELPGGMFPELPGGMMPELPGGMMPEYPGGMMPEYPGGMMPEYPGGMMPEYPGGMMPGCPGGMMPVYPPGEMPYDEGEVMVARMGDRGNHIKMLQSRLKGMGYYCGPINGVFSRRTKCAVQKLQRDCKVKPTGAVNRYMWNSIVGYY